MAELGFSPAACSIILKFVQCTFLPLPTSLSLSLFACCSIERWIFFFTLTCLLYLRSHMLDCLAVFLTLSSKRVEHLVFYSFTCLHTTTVWNQAAQRRVGGSQAAAAVKKKMNQNLCVFLPLNYFGQRFFSIHHKTFLFFLLCDLKLIDLLIFYLKLFLFEFAQGAGTFFSRLSSKKISYFLSIEAHGAKNSVTCVSFISKVNIIKSTPPLSSVLL